MRYLAALLASLLVSPAQATYTQVVETHSYTAASPSGGGTNIFYAAGYYVAPTTDANLTQAAASITLGSANQTYAAKVFIVAGGAGTATGGAGAVSLTVTGTTRTEAGVRTTGVTETIVSDITALSLDEYAEVDTGVRWLGQVTIALSCTGGCTHTTYALDFNYGFVNAESLRSRDYTLNEGYCQGLAAANDTGFEIELILHSSTGHTYAATGFTPGPPAALTFTTDNGTESDLTSGQPFLWRRTGINAPVLGSQGQGFIIRATTTAANAVLYMLCEGTFTVSPFFD